MIPSKEADGPLIAGHDPLPDSQLGGIEALGLELAQLLGRLAQESPSWRACTALRAPEWPR